MGDSRRKYSLHEVASIIQMRSIPEPNSGCLLWEGLLRQETRKRVKQLYGQIRLRGKMVGVHRVAFEAAYGPIPEGAEVLHQCDVTICCNPNHLFLGTNAENIADKVAKDRARKSLTIDKAREIYALAKSGLPQKQIAERFGVRQPMVSRILSGKRRPNASIPTNKGI